MEPVIYSRVSKGSVTQFWIKETISSQSKSCTKDHADNIQNGN
jgi:hypothetical protein